MRKALLLLVLVSACLSTAFCADRLRMKRILSWQRLNGASAEARDFARGLLRGSWQDVRFAINREGKWVIASPDGVLADGKHYDVALGKSVRVALDRKGSWVATGQDAAMADGRRVRSPATARALHEDVHTWKSTRIGSTGSRSSAGKGAFSPQGVFPLREKAQAKAVYPLAGDGQGITIIKDTTPPWVKSIEIVRNPLTPEKTTVHRPPRVFVGAESIHIRVTMSERMGAAPRVLLTQPNMEQPVAANLVDQTADTVFRYHWYPNAAPSANGPTKIEITGDKDGVVPDYGYDLAGNPIQEGSPDSSIEQAMLVDTVEPDLRRVDTSVPGNIQTRPSNGEVIAGHEFPESILVYVADYDQPDDGSFDGPNVATGQASGVDYDAIRLRDGTMDVRLFDPRGQQITGTLVARQPALELLLPDVYDPGLGIFPDTDGDGYADPIEGNYRVEVSLVDKVGNSVQQTAVIGMDATPIFSRQVNVTIQPIFSEPFPNPVNPIANEGTCVKKLEAIEIASPDPDFDARRTTAKLTSYVKGHWMIPREVKTTIRHEEDRVILTVDRDQDGDGKVDFENPPPGQYLPPGMTDPRHGKNDGMYVVEVTAYDKAGNASTIKREIKVDTTAPQVQATFPAADVTIGPPLRLVDAIVVDPTPTSGSQAGGIDYEHFLIWVDFKGNDQTPPQRVNGVGFIHAPNYLDPTQPDFNPNDTVPKLLYEFTDPSGHVVSLPDDGTWDGVYEIHLTAFDEAGNEVVGSAAFTFSSTASATPTAPVEVPLVISLRR